MAYRDMILATPGLIAFWPLNETSGDIANDAGPGDYDLSSGVLGPPTWGQAAGPPGEATAGFGAGLGEYLGTGFPVLTSALTMEIWASRSDLLHGVLLYQGVPISFHQAGVGLSIGASNEGARNRPKVVIGNTSTGPNVIEADDPLAVNTWIHLAVTYDGTTWILYVNGVAQPITSTAAYTPVTTGDIYIGTDKLLSSRFFNGDLSYAAVYARALTPTEIGEHFSPPPVTGASVSTWAFSADVSGRVRGKGLSPVACDDLALGFAASDVLVADVVYCDVLMFGTGAAGDCCYGGGCYDKCCYGAGEGCYSECCYGDNCFGEGGCCNCDGSGDMCDHLTLEPAICT